MQPDKKIRILYVENGIGYGGAIICLRHLVRNLDRCRFEPMVVTGRTGPDYEGIAHEAHWRYIRDRRIDIPNLQKRTEVFRWPERIPGLRTVLMQVLARADDLINFLPFFTGLLWTAWRYQPALIHANNEPLCNRASILVGRTLGIPVICHIRGDQKGSRMMAWMFRLPDYFIAVSSWVSESIGRLGVPQKKRAYIYDGIELEKLDLKADGVAWRAQHGLAPTDFAVGLVGLLIPWKGQRLFLEAMQELIKDIPEMKAVIVGGTPDECMAYEQALLELAHQPELAGRVIFTGHVGDMASAYNGLDVVVSASTEPEPLGTMIIECLTMARPLVAPNHGGAVEMVENGVTGLLFTPGNAHDLCVQIRKMHDDPEFRHQLGQAARTRALATFSVEEHVRHIQDVYLTLLQRPGQAA
ncbi:MAG: glycosyltransferase family 4 protein [Thiobacillus sp.]